METSVRPSRSRDTIDWREILGRLPEHVARVNGGRSPEEGFDCLGPVLWAYREAGAPLDDLDRRYSEDQAIVLNRAGLIEQSLASRLRDVTAQVRAGLDDDGDVWLLNFGRLQHASIHAGGTVYHMADKLYRRPVRYVRPWLVSAFRI